jgi:lyso-ornithine lipid O-acyltransferase
MERDLFFHKRVLYLNLPYERVKTQMKTLRALVKTVLFLCLVGIILPFQLFIIWIMPRYKLILPQVFHRILLMILNVKVTIIGNPEKALLLSNHISWLDIVVLGSVTPLSFVAKQEVEGWFLFGFLAKLQDTLFVDRNNRHKIPQSILKLSQKLKQSPMVLFAEGTTTDGSVVLPFNSSFVTTPAQAVMIYYKQKDAVAWFADMELLPHLWLVFKQPVLHVEVNFLDLYLEGNRKYIAFACEKTVRLHYETRLSVSK